MSVKLLQAGQKKLNSRHDKNNFHVVASKNGILILFFLLGRKIHLRGPEFDLAQVQKIHFVLKSFFE